MDIRNIRQDMWETKLQFSFSLRIQIRSHFVALFLYYRGEDMVVFKYSVW